MPVMSSFFNRYRFVSGWSPAQMTRGRGKSVKISSSSSLWRSGRHLAVQSPSWNSGSAYTPERTERRSVTLTILAKSACIGPIASLGRTVGARVFYAKVSYV